MLKSQKLELPPNSHPCCMKRPSRSHSATQSEGHTSYESAPSPDPTDHMSSDISQHSNWSGSLGLQRNDIQQQSFYPPHGSSYEPMEDSVQFNTMNPVGMSQTFKDFEQQRAPSMDEVPMDFGHEGFGSQTQSSMSNPMISPYTYTGQSHLEVPLGSSRAWRPRRQRAAETFDWTAPFESVEQPQQNLIAPARSVSSPSPQPSRRNQTTIRVEDADASTVSAVIGLLVDSNAKFSCEAPEQ